MHIKLISNYFKVPHSVNYFMGSRIDKLKAKNKKINELEAENKRLRNQLERLRGYNSRGPTAGPNFTTTRTAVEKRSWWVIVYNRT